MIHLGGPCPHSSILPSPSGLGAFVVIESSIDSSVSILAKVDKGGEDAYLVSTYEGGVIAVADGVSG